MITIATVLMLLSYSAILAGLADESADEINRTAAFGFGLAAVPFVFMTLAFGSRHRRAPTAVLASLGVWLVVSLLFGLGSLALGLSLGFGVAGTFSLRRDEHHSHKVRMWALAVGFVYTLVLLAIAPALGLFAAATVPFIALGFGDQFAEARAGATRKDAGSD